MEDYCLIALWLWENLIFNFWPSTRNRLLDSPQDVPRTICRFLIFLYMSNCLLLLLSGSSLLISCTVIKRQTWFKCRMFLLWINDSTYTLHPLCDRKYENLCSEAQHVSSKQFFLEVSLRDNPVHLFPASLCPCSCPKSR